MGKSGAKCLDMGPEMGESRKEALAKLLVVVETEVGRMLLRDAKRAGALANEAVGRGRGAGSGGGGGGERS